MDGRRAHYTVDNATVGCGGFVVFFVALNDSPASASVSVSTKGGPSPEEIAKRCKLMSKSLATACSPFLWIVRIVFVATRSRTNLWPSSHQSFTHCKFTFCTRWVWRIDFDTAIALPLRRLPVKSHFRSRISKTARGIYTQPRGTQEKAERSVERPPQQSTTEHNVNNNRARNNTRQTTPRGMYVEKLTARQ